MSKQVKQDSSLFTVRHNTDKNIKTKISGVLDKDNLNEAKQDFIKETIGVWADELVDVAQHYPTKGKTKVTFDIDVVVLRREVYESLMGDTEY